jgi:ABC-2 type transport system permease protein
MIGTLALYAWKQLLRDRAALVLSFVVPLGFFAIFAWLFVPDGRGMSPVRVAWVDEDGSPRAQALRRSLKAEGGLRLLTTSGKAEGPYTRSSALEAVRKGRVDAAILVPPGFGDKPLFLGGSGDPPRLEILADRANPVAANLVSGVLQQTVFRAFPRELLEGGLRAFEAFVGFEPWQQQRLAELLRDLEGPQSVEAQDKSEPPRGFSSPVHVEVRDLEGESQRKPMIRFFAASIGVMFLLFSAAGAGGALLEERESGTLDRLLATRVTLRQLFLGKLAFLTSLGVAQMGVMFAYGAAFYGLELGEVLGKLGAIVLTTAAVSAAFGLLLAAVSRTRKQLVAVSNLLILTISAIGGSMFPRMLMPEAVQRWSLVFFNSWALEGFLDVLWRGESWLGLLPELGMLLLWTTALFFLAVRVARRIELA